MSRDFRHGNYKSENAVKTNRQRKRREFVVEAPKTQRGNTSRPEHTRHDAFEDEYEYGDY